MHNLSSCRDENRVPLTLIEQARNLHVIAGEEIVEEDGWVSYLIGQHVAVGEASSRCDHPDENEKGLDNSRMEISRY